MTTTQTMSVRKTLFVSIVATIDKSVLGTYNSDGGIAALNPAKESCISDFWTLQIALEWEKRLG